MSTLREMYASAATTLYAIRNIAIMNFINGKTEFTFKTNNKNVECKIRHAHNNEWAVSVNDAEIIRIVYNDDGTVAALEV